MHIKYKLTAIVDGDVVFESDYPDTYELQSDGLRKAEYAVERQIPKDEDLINA